MVVDNVQPGVNQGLYPAPGLRVGRGLLTSYYYYL
jgi:hypothetical protein